ncbi:ICMT-domain-containing protein [Peniophora sp. CONT]|nr:ICMT-domain-containing protein [Peniophora sp. CONT]
MSQAIFKICVLATTIVAHFVTLTPPQPPAGRKDKVYRGQLFERMGVRDALITMTEILLTLAVSSEIIVISATTFDVPYSTKAYDTLCPRSRQDSRVAGTISSTFLLGAALALFGAYLRHWTYRVLGELFTYEVTLRPQHKLIRRAPYNFVRHPSYAGLYMHFAGVAIMHFAEGGWNRECGIMGTPLVFAVLFWVLIVTFSMASVWRRSIVEDDFLRSKFGTDWLLYRKEVPSKFFPGLI